MESFRQKSLSVRTQSVISRSLSQLLRACTFPPILELALAQPPPEWVTLDLEAAFRRPNPWICVAST